MIKANNEEIHIITVLEKFKALIFFFHVVTMQFSIGYACYLIYSSLRCNVKSIVLFALFNFYLKIFAKKSNNYLSICRYFEPHKWFKNFVIICEEPIDDSCCLLPFHPHSIFCFGFLLGTKKLDGPFNDCIPLAARTAVNIAPHGIPMVWAGIQGANPENFKKLMSQKKNICWLPGGFEESTMTSTKEYRLYLKTRKGFIKYALQYGYVIHPVFIFNENKCYCTSDLLMRPRLWLNKFKIPTNLFCSKYGLIPDPNVKIYIVVGKKLILPQIDQPSQYDIDKYHQLYINHLQDLFSRHVDKYDIGAKLRINQMFDTKL